MKNCEVPLQFFSKSIEKDAWWGCKGHLRLKQQKEIPVRPQDITKISCSAIPKGWAAASASQKQTFCLESGLEGTLLLAKLTSPAA